MPAKTKKSNRKKPKRYAKTTKKRVRDRAKKPKKTKLTEIDYTSILLPPADVPLTEYDSTQRRAYIARLSLQMGSVERVPTNLCSQFGITGSVICEDKKIVREYLKRRWLKPELIISESLLLMQKAGEVAVENRDSSAMRQASVEMVRMGQELGVIDKVAEKVEEKMEITGRTVEDLVKELDREE